MMMFSSALALLACLAMVVKEVMGRREDEASNKLISQSKTPSRFFFPLFFSPSRFLKIVVRLL